MHGTGIVRLAGVAAVALGVSVVLSLPAQAASSTSSHGTCSGTSTTKVKATVKGDAIVVKAKVATDVAAEAWSYSIADNGSTVVADVATTGSDGKFKVKATIPNLEGTDTVDVTATDSVTGETCTAEAVLEG
jgi:predicted secreted protein